jgi:microcystin-dependent protein
MSISKVAQFVTPPETVGDYDAQNAHIAGFTRQLAGPSMALTQWENTTTIPKLALGTYLSHGGYLYRVDTEDYVISGTPTDGTWYIRLEASGDTLIATWISDLSGYVWNAVNNGLYNGSYQLLPYQIIKAGAVYTKRKIMNLWQGGGFQTVDWEGVFGSGIVAPTVEAITFVGFTGMVAPFGASTAPFGWLACDGTAKSRTTYAKLFAVVGETFGVGDGSTTFNMPELRGEFVRGLDDSRGVDTGRTLGSAQADLFKAHTHTIPTSDSSGVFGRGIVPTDDGTPPRGNTSSTGGTETRPRNVALLYCIKY